MLPLPQGKSQVTVKVDPNLLIAPGNSCQNLSVKHPEFLSREGGTCLKRFHESGENIDLQNEEALTA
jgi:hypothetical protein